MDNTNWCLYVYSLLIFTCIYLCIFDPPLDDDDGYIHMWFIRSFIALCTALAVTLSVIAFSSLVFYF